MLSICMFRWFGKKEACYKLDVVLIYIYKMILLRRKVRGRRGDRGGRLLLGWACKYLKYNVGNLRHSLKDCEQQRKHNQMSMGIM